MWKSIVRLAVFIAIIFALTVNEAEALEYDVFTLAKNGTPEQILIALGEGADFNVSRSFYNYETGEECYTEEFENDETPLHLAAMYNHNAESLRLLLETGLAVNEIATAGNTIMETPLSCAVRNKNLSAVEELLRAGANPHIWSSGCNSSMFHIIASEYTGINTVRTFVNALLKAGGNINFHQEFTQEELKELMKDEDRRKEFRINWSSNYPLTTGDISHADSDAFLSTFTPLMYAVLFDNPDAVSVFLDAKADTSIRSLEGKTAFDYAKSLPQNTKMRRSKVFMRLKALTR